MKETAKLTPSIKKELEAVQTAYYKRCKAVQALRKKIETDRATREKAEAVLQDREREAISKLAGTSYGDVSTKEIRALQEKYPTWKLGFESKEGPVNIKQRKELSAEAQEKLQDAIFQLKLSVEFADNKEAQQLIQEWLKKPI